jgi:hypothetical protein
MEGIPMTRLSAWKMARALFMMCVVVAVVCQGQTFNTLVDFDGRDGSDPNEMTLVRGAAGPSMERQALAGTPQGAHKAQAVAPSSA